MYKVFYKVWLSIQSLIDTPNDARDEEGQALKLDTFKEKHSDDGYMLETFCGLNDARVSFKDNNSKAKYIESYVDAMLHYNFIANINEPKGDYAVTKMIRQILLQDEKINGKIVSKLSNF